MACNWVQQCGQQTVSWQTQQSTQSWSGQWGGQGGWWQPQPCQRPQPCPQQQTQWQGGCSSCGRPPWQSCCCPQAIQGCYSCGASPWQPCYCPCRPCSW